MAKAKKSTKPEAQATEAQATEAQATEAQSAPLEVNPFAALATAPASPAAPAKPSIAAKAALVNNEVTVGALPGIHAANNVAARAASLAAIPALLAKQLYTLGRPCKVRVPYTLACYEQVAAALAAGPATGEALAARSTGDLVRYAVRSGWLVAA